MSLDAALLRLPFTITPVNRAEHLQDVLRLRLTAYGRHSYERAVEDLMQAPDDMDLDGLSTTLVAVDKSTRKVVGTARLTSSLDREIEWPDDTPADECRSGVYTYIDRLAVSEQTDTALVASALIKAIYLWALSRDSQWATALALPALARIYKRRGGMEVRGNGQTVQMPQYHTAGFCLVGVRLADVRDRLARINPEYAALFFNKVHPDISVHGMSIPWTSAVRKPKLELVASNA